MSVTAEEREQIRSAQVEVDYRRRIRMQSDLIRSQQQELKLQRAEFIVRPSHILMLVSKDTERAQRIQTAHANLVQDYFNRLKAAQDKFSKELEEALTETEWAHREYENVVAVNHRLKCENQLLSAHNTTFRKDVEDLVEENKQLRSLNLKLLQRLNQKN